MANNMDIEYNMAAVQISATAKSFQHGGLPWSQLKTSHGDLQKDWATNPRATIIGAIILHPMQQSQP